LPESVTNGKAGISRIDVDRTWQDYALPFTAKPGILIGRKGEGVKKIRRGARNSGRKEDRT
jgi:ribosomal protein S3